MAKESDKMASSWEEKRGSFCQSASKSPKKKASTPAKVAVVLGLCLSAVAAIAVWQGERETLAIQLQETTENLRSALQEQIDRNRDFTGDNFSAAELLEATLPGQVLNDLNIYLYEETPEGKSQPLALYEFNAHTFISDAIAQPKLSGRGWLCPEFSVASSSPTGRAFRQLRQTQTTGKPCKRSLSVGERQWSLLLLPTPAYLAPYKYWQSWGIFLGGLILTSLLATYLLVSGRYTQQVEELVEERTIKAQQLQKALEELQETQGMLVHSEKMSSLGQMVAGIAHEINNPVNFVCGNIDCVKEYTQDLLKLMGIYQQHYPHPAAEIEEFISEIDLDFLAEDLPKILNSMQVGVDRISQIVLSMRNFSRLDRAEMQAVDLHEGIESTLLILNNRFQAKPGSYGIKLVKEYGDLPLVECNVGQLNQVFMNIVANAIDAIQSYDKQRSHEEKKANPSWIAIKTSLGTASGSPVRSDYVTVTIADNGPGIPVEIQQKIFDPFFTTKPVGKGTGLGMSIAYKMVVDGHGGTLRCWSEVGRGTEFKIDLPIKQISKEKKSNSMRVAVA
jgi:signal transduction histidine kinase